MKSAIMTLVLNPEGRQTDSHIVRKHVSHFFGTTKKQLQNSCMIKSLLTTNDHIPLPLIQERDKSLG